MLFRFKVFLLLAFCFLFVSCSTTPVFVDIHPEVTQQAIFDGYKTPVNLLIYDKRDTDALGYHGYDNKSRGYFPKQNLQVAVSSAMYHILNQNNFVLSAAMTRTLIINILAVQFGAVDDITSTDLSAETALEVVATHNGREFRKIYHGDVDSNILLYVKTDQIQHDINHSLAEALNNIARDKNLWLFLTEK